MRATHFLSAFLLLAGSIYSQKTIREYVDGTDKEKIKKSILIEQQPVTAGGFADGHSRWPLLTSPDQLPDTIALICRTSAPVPPYMM